VIELQIENFKIKHGSRKDKFDIVFLGDIHVGSASFDRDYFENMIDFLAEQDNYRIVGMGDFMENTPPNHHNFDWTHIDKEFLNADDQHAYIVEWFSKIDDKILGLIEGEHDLRTSPLTGHSWTRWTCHDLNIPYLGLSSIFRLTFQRIHERRSWDFYIWHGRYSGRKIGGAVNKLHEAASNWNCDIYAMGGTHYLHADIDQVGLLNSSGNLEKRKRAFLLTGSFLESYQEDIDSYAEPKQYPLQRMGSPKVKIYPSKGDLHVST
jgi:hypothetical protein